MSTRKLPCLLASLHKHRRILPCLNPQKCCFATYLLPNRRCLNVHPTPLGNRRCMSGYQTSHTAAALATNPARHIHPPEFNLDEFVRQWEFHRILSAVPKMSTSDFNALTERLRVLNPKDMALEVNTRFRLTIPVMEIPPLSKMGKDYRLQFSLELHNSWEYAEQMFTLKPISTVLNNRLGRRYGSHRILRVLVKRERSVGSSRFEGPLCWSRDLKLMRIGSMIYEFLYVHKTATEGIEAVFFATSGMGMKSVSIRDVLGWALPLEGNTSMTLAKYAARLDLSLSKTQSTAVLEKDEIHLVDDVFSETTGQCMTDGCAAVSKKVMQQIQKILEMDEMPSAIQARLGSAKGIWYLANEAEEKRMVEEFGQEEWVECSPSQIKFKLPNPERDQLTIEIVKASSGPQIAMLNQDIIPVLQTGGVPVGIFLAMQDEFLHRKQKRLFSNNRNVVLRELRRPDRQADPVYQRLVHRCLQMVSAGFPATEEIIRLCRYYTSTIHRSALQKNVVEVPKSRYVMMIAPRVGNPLKEGEVFCNITTSNDDTGIPAGILKGPVLLARNPCLLPSDAMVVTAVDYPELRHLKNVLVMPIQGDISLASKLSGGDYDGDHVFVTWDERITNTYENSPVSQIEARVDRCFGRAATTVADIVGTELNYKNLQNTLFQDFILYYEGVTTNGRTKGGSLKKIPQSLLLPRYYKWHQRCAQMRGSDDDDAIFLAHIAARLVDARKSGDVLHPQVYKSHNNRYGNMGEEKMWGDDFSHARVDALTVMRESVPPYSDLMNELEKRVQATPAKIFRDEDIQAFVTRHYKLAACPRSKSALRWLVKENLVFFEKVQSACQVAVRLKDYDYVEEWKVRWERMMDELPVTENGAGMPLKTDFVLEEGACLKMLSAAICFQTPGSHSLVLPVALEWICKAKKAERERRERKGICKEETRLDSGVI